MQQLVIGIVLGLYVAMSVVTFMAYAIDKRASRLGNRRIPEIRLHFFELAFGWPGAFLGRKLLRHKTIKKEYVLVFWLIGLLHLTAWAVVAWQLLTRGGDAA
jgi:uncharacterized membrane protein YsdA (DUF1294 family)